MWHIQEITNSKQWEDFLTQYHTNTYPFFQTWEWGEVQKKLGWHIERIGIFEEKKLVGVCLVVFVKAKRGHYLYLRHGPLFIKPTEDLFSFFLSEMKKYAKKYDASFLRISRFPKEALISEKFLEKKGFLHSALQTTDASVCWVLGLDAPEAALLQQMRKSHRYLVKKAKSLPITVIKTSDPKDLSLFMPLYKELSQRKHFVVHKGLQEEFSIFSQEKKAMLFLAKYEGEIIAGAFIDFVGDTAVYHHGASNEQYRHIPASYLLQWEAILEAKKRGLRYYNFWGIAPLGAKKHPWSGITLFKTGFGGENEYYLPVMDLPLRFAYWKNYIIDALSALRKG